MTLPPFSISVQKGVLRAVLRGYWNMPTAEAYIAELTRTAEHSSSPSCWLVDVTGFVVQSSDVNDRLASGIGLAKERASPTVVLVGNSALGARQAKRAANDHKQVYFTDVAAAEAWIFDHRSQTTSANRPQ